MTALVVDDFLPICNGIMFDDAETLPAQALHHAISRAEVFCTQFEAGGRVYGGTIVAPSWDAAEWCAGARGLGERVVGVLCLSRVEGAH
jgi:hypothetical protein